MISAALSISFNDIDICSEQGGLPSPRPVRPCERYPRPKIPREVRHANSTCQRLFWLVYSEYSTCTKFGHSI